MRLDHAWFLNSLRTGDATSVPMSDLPNGLDSLNNRPLRLLAKTQAAASHHGQCSARSKSLRMSRRKSQVK